MRWKNETGVRGSTIFVRASAMRETLDVDVVGDVVGVGAARLTTADPAGEGIPAGVPAEEGYVSYVNITHFHNSYF